MLDRVQDGFKWLADLRSKLSHVGWVFGFA